MGSFRKHNNIDTIALTKTIIPNSLKKMFVCLFFNLNNWSIESGTNMADMTFNIKFAFSSFILQFIF